MILISAYFRDENSTDKLNIFLEMFKNKKKIILTSNSNIYSTPKKFLTPNKLYSINLTLFDNFLLENKTEKKFIDRNLSSDDKNEINNYYYENLDLVKLNKINSRLKKLAEKHNIQILYKDDFQCNLDKKICFGVTDGGMKSHYDYGHYTLEGAKFFGKKIFDIKWLKIN